MTLKIAGIRTRAVAAPINRPPLTASGAIPKAALVLIDLDTDGGVIGRAYLFAFISSMLKPTMQCVEALDELLRGDILAPLAIEEKLHRKFALLDTRGILGQALAGVDMAAWDALAQSQGLPLARLLGAQTGPIPAYNSCGLWIQDPEKLADEAEALLAEGGFNALKIRVGRARFKDDLVAVRKVRERIGDDILLMSDFNQSLTVDEAIRRGRALDAEGVYWIEEPIRHDDFKGCARVAAQLKTPIQIGENLHDVGEMHRAIEARSATYLMPDVQRIGGVSGWMRAAAIADLHGVKLSSHLFPEFSAHLLAATPTRHWLEYLDWSNAILEHPLLPVNGFVHVPERPGAGIEWNEDAIRRYALQ